jgi:serine/threonine protein kinase
MGSIMAIKCPKCQVENTSDSQFCKKCATPLPSSREFGISQTQTLPPPKEDLTTGSIFAGRYQVIEELGHGGMGKVYKVFDSETDSKVALKLIKPEVSADKSTIDRFRNELKIARDISHKHICRMYDLGREADNYFITMEFVSGEDLRSLIRRTKRLDIGTAISIAKQVCEGLAEAHRVGVVHRDLKPSNIMIDREGEAKILDFGIARSLRTKAITGPGVVIGTPEYMSPEQVDGKEADQRADLYSLSIIFYEIVTGEVPFEGESAFAIGLKHKSDLPENPKKINPQIPDDLCRLILKGLEKDKDRRYQTAEELLSELTRIEQGLPAREKLVPRRKPLTSREITVSFSLRRFIIPALAIVAVAIGTVLLFFLSNRQPSKRPILPSHKQLTFAGDASMPAVSPDGKFIAYVTGEFGSEKVWVQDLTSGHSIEIFSAVYCNYPRWTPDSSEVTFSGVKDSQNFIFLVPRLGGPARQLKGFPYFAWSPDGTQLAGTYQGRGSRIEEISIVTKATGKSTSFSLEPRSDLNYDIDWSPQGERLLILRSGKEKQYSMWTVKTDGNEQNLIIEDDKLISSPRWTSKGDAIIFIRGSSSNQKELWKVPISRDTGKPTKTASVVLSGISLGEYFNLSADGKYLPYTRELEYSNLWLAQIEGTDKGPEVKTRQLTSGTLTNSMPRLSPDGKMVAFSRGNGESANIYVMPLAGGDPTQLTFFNSDNPVWSPDGTEIAFGSDEGGKNRVWKVSVQGGSPVQFEKTELGGGGWIVWAPGSSILYRRAGTDNLRILNPKTGEEIPFISDEPVEQMLFPLDYSPDGKNVLANWVCRAKNKHGLYIISLKDFSDKLLLDVPKGFYPGLLGWSTDGKWAYVEHNREGKTTFLGIEVASGRTKSLPTLQYMIEGKTYHKVIESQPEIIEDAKVQSDVWIIQNFDQIIK